jgi:uncharacterized protein YjdB
MPDPSITPAAMSIESFSGGVSLSRQRQISVPFSNSGGADVPTWIPVVGGSGSGFEYSGEFSMSLGLDVVARYDPGVLGSYALFDVRVPYDIGLEFDFSCKTLVKGKLGIASMIAKKLAGLTFGAGLILKFITPAEVYIHLDIAAGVDCSVSYEQAGVIGKRFEYNRNYLVVASVSFQTINERRPTEPNRFELEVEGRVRVAVELVLGVFPVSVKSWVFAGLNVYAGLEGRGTLRAATGGSPLVAERHACTLCLHVGVYGIYEVFIGAKINISFIKRDFPLVALGDRNNPILFGDAHFSMANSSLSVHGGLPAIGLGRCPNFQYRTTFDPINQRENTVDNAAVTALGERDRRITGTGRFAEHLYPGQYTASATSSGMVFQNRTFGVNEANKNQVIRIEQRFVSVESLTLNRTSMEMAIGDTERLAATIAPANATNKSLTWSSDTPSVATVVGGVVVANAPGTARITVSSHDGSRTSISTITVTPVRITGLRLNKSRTAILMGYDENLTAIIAPSNATDQRISWSTTNPSVATVSANGVVRGISPGRVTITATSVDGNFRATVDATITDFPIPVTGITLSDAAVSIRRQDNRTITATVLSANSSNPPATNQNVTWSSSNPSVATVVGGRINALALGTTIITATTVDGGFTATCTVTVTPIHVTHVVLSDTERELFVGDGFWLTQTVFPNNTPLHADDRSVTWSSSHPTIASVSSSGYVTALSASTTPVIITVTTNDGSHTATCVVRVNRRPNPLTGSVTLQSVGNGRVVLQSNVAASSGNVQYAINTSSTPPVSGWQSRTGSTITFDGLTNQTHYVFVRAEETPSFVRVDPRQMLELSATGWRIRIRENLVDDAAGTITYSVDGSEVRSWTATGTGDFTTSPNINAAPWSIQNLTVRWNYPTGIARSIEINPLEIWLISPDGQERHYKNLGRFRKTSIVNIGGGSQSETYNIW